MSTSRPVAVRAVFWIVRLASLVLGVVGVALAGAAIFSAFQISGSDHRQRLAINVTLWYGYRVTAVLAVALILRWVLRFNGRFLKIDELKNGTGPGTGPIL